ncbi:MAG: right-handed parallel beta-helix repeat-containing protein [Alphaproteobacteria bacterium]
MGDTNQGFTIVGIDNGFPGIENAALYLQGNQSNHIIRGNDIVANGDSGLTSEFGATVSDIIIDDNIFSGQTFTGANPAGVGFGSQFTTPNVPRQLVVMGGGTGGGNTSNITFTNNQITGTAGGISTDDNVSPQGNTLVTIDSKGAIITGNTFHGETTRFGSSLRSRGTNTLISGNTFYADGLTDTNAHLFVHSGIYDGANVDGIQDDIMDIWNSNTFIGRATVTDNDIDPNFDGIGLTIQGAINASNSGANVFVNGATYTENLLIDRALKLTGLPGATLQAAGAGSLITVTAANVNIDPFAFDGLGIASYGINANGAHNLVVDGNSFANFLDTNINVTNSNAVRIKNNTMTGAQKGVFGDNTKDMHVFDNDISGTTVAGIHIKNSDGVGYNGGQNDIDIWSNTVASAAGTGIWVQNSKFASIGDHPTNPFETGYGGANIVTGGSAGIVVENSDKAWISHNIVDDINGDGIAIHGGADVTVLKNKVGTNGAADNIKGDGIFAQNANNILISMNTVDETHSTSNAKGSGIQVLGSNNANINQNTITNAGWDSVRVVGGNNVSIHKNTGTNSKRAGIYAEGLTNSSVTENTIDGTAQFRGISVQGGNNILVGKNKVDNTKLDGIIANNVQNLTVDGNLVGKNAGNIGAHGISIDAANNTTTNVTNNQVANTAQNGVHFANGINGGTTTVSGNTISGAQDGVHFDGHVENNAQIDIKNNSSIVGENDDGIEFNGIRGNSVVSIENNGINANDNGIEFNAGSPSIEDSTVNIVHNTINADGDGIYVDDDIDNSTVNIKKNSIYASQNGIDIDHVLNSTVNIGGHGTYDGNRIVADNGNGIEIDAGIDGSNVLIKKNRISADEDGINIRDEDYGHVTGVDNNSTVSIYNNEIGSQGSDSIGDDGIDFDDSVTGGSTVNIGYNNSHLEMASEIWY